MEARQSATKTFVPGEGIDDEGKSFVVANFSDAEKEQIRELLAGAKSAKEVEEIENAVRRGILPAALINKRKREEQAETGSNKVSDDDGADVQASKRRKAK